MNVQELLEELGVATVGKEHKHGRTGWINFDCPFCELGTGKRHMGFNPARKSISCWKCGRHGIIDVLVRLGASPSVARTAYGAFQDSYRRRAPEVVRGTLKLPYHKPMRKQHKDYIRKRRKMDPDEIERLWDVRGVAHHASLPWSLLIPIYLDGEVVSWTTRAIRKSKLRYWSASPEEESVPHKQLLYGEDYCRHTVIVHEGPIDVWATGPGAVATFGLSFTDGQLQRLSEYSTRVVCFDSSDSAQQAAKELCGLLDVFPGSTFNVLLETGSDPADADKEEIEELRKEFLH